MLRPPSAGHSVRHFGIDTPTEEVLVETDFPGLTYLITETRQAVSRMQEPSRSDTLEREKMESQLRREEGERFGHLSELDSLRHG